ncbi:MAG: isoleucine--tRNA ligase [Bacteroidota bacterium]|nr:isoleucine--tRNA ligase [Bacteroidota bacterium]
MVKYREYKNYDHLINEKEVTEFWNNENIFEKSISSREGNKEFVFYEGPPSANGLPGIHHVISRTIKDIFCRYKTLKGHQVKRKAGWDTHGLPVEISVEKNLGITKEDIGKSISVEDYNNACRNDVLKYKEEWNKITQSMGYWLNLDDAYITFKNKYIETVWWLLKKLFDKGLLYKGYTIQPYSPAAGTGLSTHEINQPGCYKDVKDNSAVCQFKVIKDEKSQFLFDKSETDVHILAWTTTPWTLPSNTALAIGKKIDYVLIKSFNRYSGNPITVVVAKELAGKYFSEENKDIKFEDYRIGDKKIPFKVIDEFKGKELIGINFEQLLDFAQPTDGKAFVVVAGDFVTTEDGTGIVHIAPSFGADDMKVAKENGLGSLTMVNKKGQFIDEMGEFAGKYVKAEYDKNFDPKKDENVDIEIIVKLKKENKLFKSEKYQHSYPHCWRTDKPILYYPLDSWFVKTTAFKDRLVELNKTINWKPQSTGTGRFENWLENLVDWNLSRSRFWGTPLPIWVSEDGNEIKCIGSVKELKTEIEKSVEKAFMKNNPLADFDPADMSEKNYEIFDLHRPYVDDIILVSESGKRMKREPDLIDVWFDSGAMPYAQFHYPFENKEVKNYFPADFISEGVDQTRGWFFTLHAIATMTFDSVAYKACISHGLVLDSKGNKMSKRLGNAVDPFNIINKYGADSTRWYMITNAQPWENLKFDKQGVSDVKRKFFGTLFNTYSFFALYANIDNFSYKEKEIPLEEKPEIDRWIISEMNSLIKKTTEFYENYEPTKAGRAIQDFVSDKLSNWYVRLSRRRFWKGDYEHDKISAFQTLYDCLINLSKLISPIAPFFAENIFKNLNDISKKENFASVHLSNFPEFINDYIDIDLEERMDIAQKTSSMVLSLRKKETIKVRQPLNKILIPVIDKKFKKQVESIEELILSETNVKEIEFVTDTSGIITKKIKPDFKKLGPKYGKLMKHIAAKVKQFTQKDISTIENEGVYKFNANGNDIEIELSDVEIFSEDIPGWLVANIGKLTVALDINISEDLKNEGIARELINRIQNLRKAKGYDVTDHIHINIVKETVIDKAINQYKDYICTETLADILEFKDKIENQDKEIIEINGIETSIQIKKK